MLSMSFTVRSVDQEFADALSWHLEPFRLDTPEQNAFPVDLFIQEEDRETEPPPYSFFLATSNAFKHPSTLDVLLHALWALNAALPNMVRDFLLLHSGAVGRDGDVMLLPAPMDSGKSSLVVALLEKGFSYLSDEFGALDPVTGQAYPVPRPPGLDWPAVQLLPGLKDRLSRAGLNQQLPQYYIRPQDVGSSVAGPGPVRYLVFPTTDWEGPPRLSPMSSAQAVEDMARAGFNLFRYGDRGVILLTRVAKQAQAFALHGGTPRERASLLAESLD